MKMKMLIAVGLCAAIFFSCKKDGPGATTTIRDTVYLPAAVLTNAQRLVANRWKVGEAWQHVNGVTTHYVRGVSDNTGNNYDVIRYQFNADGTGTTIDPQGNTYNITWQFTTTDQENLRITVNGNVVYNYGLVNFQGTNFYQSSVFNNSLNTGKWIPE